MTHSLSKTSDGAENAGKHLSSRHMGKSIAMRNLGLASLQFALPPCGALSLADDD